jgi:type II secretory pathway pseudopilin PulG
MVVLGIMMVVAGMAFVNMSGAMNDAKVVTGYNTVLGTMRRARETAISERRIYRVRFDTPQTECNTQTHTTGNSCVLLIKNPLDATSTIVYAGALPPGVGYNVNGVFPNTAALAPDGLVTGAALAGICMDIGVLTTCPNEIDFYPDGSSRDANQFMNSGVVYVSRVGDLNTARAITVLGATARIRGWHLAKQGATYFWNMR